MPEKTKTFLTKKITGAVLGIAIGLFVGVFILGTVIRIIFSSIFGWGDSAPIWGIWTEGMLTAAVTVASLYFSVKWFMAPKKES